MKKLHILLSAMLLLLFLPSCSSDEFVYSFHQDVRNVERIEICSHNVADHTTTLLVELSDNEEQAILSELSSLPCFEYSIGDYPRNYGELVILIHYQNGEAEVIGLHNTGWISTDGKWNFTRVSFDWGEIKDLLEQYVGTEIISEIYG